MAKMRGAQLRPTISPRRSPNSASHVSSSMLPDTAQTGRRNRLGTYEGAMPYATPAPDWELLAVLASAEWALREQ